MSRRDLPPDVRELLESGKEVPRQPNAVRARVLARARNTAAAPLPAPEPVGALSARPSLHPAAAVGALAIGGAVVVLGVKAAWRSEPVERAVPHSAQTKSSLPKPEPRTVPELTASTPVPEPTNAEPGAGGTAKIPPGHASDPVTTKGSYEAELKLMRGAHTAFAAHDYTAALTLAQEHAQRFPNGVLAEEREALKVRSLASSGRTAEARRAAATFARHFPRSVLARRLQAELGAGAE